MKKKLVLQQTTQPTLADRRHALEEQVVAECRAVIARSGLTYGVALLALTTSTFRGIKAGEIAGVSTWIEAKQAPKPPGPNKGRKFGPAPVKFKDAKTGKTWSGRGKKPAWVKVKLHRVVP
jgi:DNA-binding protein H-NS